MQITVQQFLEIFEQKYNEFYPTRTPPARYINSCVTFLGVHIKDTGICSRVVDMAVEIFGSAVQPFYCVRPYDAPDGDGFDDLPVHVGLMHNGKFYDTYDQSGVVNFDDLQFNAMQQENNHYLCTDEEDKMNYSVMFEDDSHSLVLSFIRMYFISTGVLRVQNNFSPRKVQKMFDEALPA